MLNQIVEFLSDKITHLMKVSQDIYRKGHSSTTVLLRIRDDTLRAMKKSEVTLIAFADFCKAFDTVDYSVVLSKLHAKGFTGNSLNWVLSHLTSRKQFVQVNDRQSNSVDVPIRVPQGSILRHLLFNLYVNDLQRNLNCSRFQYTDDHSSPRNLSACEQ